MRCIKSNYISPCRTRFFYNITCSCVPFLCWIKTPCWLKARVTEPDCITVSYQIRQSRFFHCSRCRAAFGEPPDQVRQVEGGLSIAFSVGGSDGGKEFGTGFPAYCRTIAFQVTGRRFGRGEHHDSPDRYASLAGDCRMKRRFFCRPVRTGGTAG